MIEVKNLVKRYGNLLALDHFNLSVKDGEIFGLLGPNGSGKAPPSTVCWHCSSMSRARSICSANP